MRDIVKVSVVDFHTAWGDKEKNIAKMEDCMRVAAAEGSNIIVFPEMALTGYDDDAEVERSEKMQVRLAESVPGPSTERLAELAKRLGIYSVFGMPEADDADSSKVYNAAAVVGPQGIVGSYRKMHCFGDESNWASRGDKPFLFDTPWGPMGVSVCYDTFNFPEIVRFYRAKGARLVLSCTANSTAACPRPPLIRAELEGTILQNWVYIASANLCGKDRRDFFMGGSSVAGPSPQGDSVCYYTGNPYYSEEGKRVAMHASTIDLSIADEGVLPVFKPNPATGTPDYNPRAYLSMLSELLAEECAKEYHGR